MQAGRHGSSAPGSGGPLFYHLRAVGVGKAHLFLSGSSSSSVSVRCVGVYSNQQKGDPGLGLKLNAGLIPSPTQRPEAILTLPLVKQDCLVLMAFLSNLLTYSDLPMSPKFPSLSVVLYWDF